MHVRCALSAGVLQRCHVALYFHHRLIGEGSVKYHGTDRHSVVVALHLNSFGRGLVQAARVRLRVTIVASARLRSGRTITASSHLRLR